MGLTTWSGDKPCKANVVVAKNYLSEKELDILNRIVNFYLKFAELQAMEQRPMYMKDWIVKRMKKNITPSIWRHFKPIMKNYSTVWMPCMRTSLMAE